MDTSGPIILWFRRDLRLADHPALTAALQKGAPVLPLYIHPAEEDPGAGAASRWWLHHSLSALDARLKAVGARLILRRGKPLQVLLALCREYKVGSIHVSRCYDPSTEKADRFLEGQLRHQGVLWQSHRGTLLQEPSSFFNKSGKPFQVFTPFWRALSHEEAPPAPLPAPRRWPWPSPCPTGETLDSCGLLPSVPWDQGFQEAWQPGEAGAQARLSAFLDTDREVYPLQRDLPGSKGTSRLSPHLHFGEITPGQIYHATRNQLSMGSSTAKSPMGDAFVRQLVWREFAHHLLFHFPETLREPLRPAFKAFPWREDRGLLRAWQEGRTGYPIVDAGMRELWATGWMHNRVRMIVGSFLVKHLLLHWRHGAEWFWDTLVDADLANNTLGWQWIAGCGADAAPYFRIFNPMTQSEKFDTKGRYLRRWVPEIARLPDADLHAPWKARPETLDRANIRLGKTYPQPVVNHMIARETAMDAYHRMKAQG
ncbi:MAG: deoxyribodipyrimidine photo-lyase [Verrucomicrobiota bacterium]|nr:deoxyribodipyrimidine photo-lyase [Verrucomicrobiota bacterium]